VTNFGISIEPTWPLKDSIDLSILAERCGYSNIWVPDGGPSPPFGDTIVSLAAIATSTRRIKFGSSILNFYTRNPASIASSFLALSDLGSSPAQRAVLGIGIGASWTVGKFGIEHRVGVITQLREAIESITELFGGKQVDIRTDSFTIEGVTLSESRKIIPIYVGSSSPRGLELSGEVADGVILADRIPQDLDHSVQSIALGLDRSSRRRSRFEVVNSVVISLDDDLARARRAVAPTCAYLVSWLSDEKAEKYQIDLSVKSKISRFISSGDERSAGRLVDSKMIGLLTATGDAERCSQKCKEYLEHKVDQLAFCEPFGPEPKRSISDLAKKVIPRL
jgi:5,10-methylenetetrahydromethanopterin reductase